MVNHEIRAGDNADLTKERRLCSFDTEALAAELQGGRQKLEKKREISRKIEENKELVDPKHHEFLAREDSMTETARKTKEFAKMVASVVDMNDPNEIRHFLYETNGVNGNPLVLQYDMFIPAIAGQCDDSQLRQWLPRARSLEIIGTYAQTEMGHGTSLRDLETTATFDKTRDEFVLDTPTLTAIKWWPGNLGKSSNYAIVVAQLIVDGKRIGPHNFLLPIRCEKTHEALPGVELGDIGPKFGLNGIDNGFMRLSGVRVPRRNMLMRHASLSAEGIYTPAPHSKLGYAAMVFVRSSMCRSQGIYLSRASTIAIRYSAVRRQGRINPKGTEVQVLDYQTQQYRLFPQVARAVSFLFMGDELMELYERVIENMQLDLLPDLHALTSGLKAVVTHQVGLGIEQCRQGCGGHGYSLASGLPQLFTSAIAGATYEGENMVMLQQAARFLLKAVMNAQSGAPLSATVAYFGRPAGRRSLIGEADTPDGQVEAKLQALEHASRRVMLAAAASLQESVAGGRSQQQAWNACAVDLTKAARLHTRACLARSFARRVSRAVDGGVRDVLGDLLSLNLHYELLEIAPHLLHDGFVTPDQIALIKKVLYEDLEKLRPNIVSIVDSFDISDRALNSAIGRRNGNVYDALYEWARSSELNRQDVLPFVGKHLRPMMDHAKAASKL